MILWKGKGILVLLITLAIAIIERLIVNQFIGPEVYQTEKWPIPLAITISASIVTFLGIRLNYDPSNHRFDPENTEPLPNKVVHSLFWIRMEYWGILLFIISGSMYFLSV